MRLIVVRSFAHLEAELQNSHLHLHCASQLSMRRAENTKKGWNSRRCRVKQLLKTVKGQKISSSFAKYFSPISWFILFFDLWLITFIRLLRQTTDSKVGNLHNFFWWFTNQNLYWQQHWDYRYLARYTFSCIGKLTRRHTMALNHI